MGSMPLVSTACSCSISLKISFSCMSVCSLCASLISIRARCAMRLTSLEVSAIERSYLSRATRGFAVQSRILSFMRDINRMTPVFINCSRTIGYHTAFIFPHRGKLRIPSCSDF